MRVAESTQNPIWLFQTRHVEVPDMISGVYYDDDEECYCEPQWNGDGKPISDKELIDDGYAIEYWQTESVWISREEAEGWGEQHSYDYGKKDEEWRVYCVCAKGELAKILDAETT
jgi:hypothetical protein